MREWVDAYERLVMVIAQKSVLPREAYDQAYSRAYERFMMACRKLYELTAAGEVLGR